MLKIFFFLLEGKKRVCLKKCDPSGPQFGTKSRLCRAMNPIATKKNTLCNVFFLEKHNLFYYENPIMSARTTGSKDGEIFSIHTTKSEIHKIR